MFFKYGKRFKLFILIELCLFNLTMSTVIHLWIVTHPRVWVERSAPGNQTDAAHRRGPHNPRQKTTQAETGSEPHVSGQSHGECTHFNGTTP